MRYEPETQNHNYPIITPIILDCDQTILEMINDIIIHKITTINQIYILVKPVLRAFEVLKIFNHFSSGDLSRINTNNFIILSISVKKINESNTSASIKRQLCLFAL